MTPEPSGPSDNAGLLNHAAQGVLGWAVPLAVTFVTTPLIVHGLGPDGFAVYAWAAAFAAGIATAGPARGVLHLVSRSGSRARREAIAAGLVTAVALGVLAAAVLWVLTPVAASAAQLPAAMATPALRIAVIGALPAAVIAVCVGALQGLKRFGLAAALTGIAAVVTAAGAAWIATSAGGVVAMVSWQAAASLVISVAGVIALRRAVGPLWITPTRTAATGVAGFGLATICTQLAFAAWVIIERTLVGRYLGAEVLTALVIGLLLWMHATAALGSAVQVVASLAPAGAASADDRLVRAYPSATVMSAVVAVASAALIAGLGVPALTLWIGAGIASVADPLLLPLALGVGLNGLGTAAWFANEAEGRPSRNAAWAATGLVLTAVTLLLLAPQGQVASAGIARLVAVAPGPLFIVWTERASAGRLRAPWLSILTCVLPCGILLFAGLRTVAVAAASSWLILIAAAAVGLALYAAAVWFLPVLTGRDRLALRTWVVGRPFRGANWRG